MRESSPRRVALLAGVFLGGSLLAWKLLSHRSDHPFILGYSLPDLALVVSCLGAARYALLLFRRFGRRAWYILLKITGALVLCFTMIELGLHAYAFWRPSYQVVFLQPDRWVGWTQVPNLRWTWTGSSFAAVDFSVPIETNSLGFRDLNRHVEKHRGVVRIALVGDSLVEALQVDFSKTAGSLLERRLNAQERRDQLRSDRYEVLNFGISNFGVGQYLLVWEHYVRRFTPDYVFVFVSWLQMGRTVSKFEMGGFDGSKRKHLSVRPIFRLEGDRLILEEVQDFDEFVKAQHDLVQKEFHGSRMRKRQVGFVLGALPGLLSKGLMILQHRLESGRNPFPERIVDEGTVRVNLKIIERLNQSVRKTGGKLVVVDAVR